MAKKTKKLIKKHAKNVKLIVNRDYIALAYFFDRKGNRK